MAPERPDVPSSGPTNPVGLPVGLHVVLGASAAAGVAAGVAAQLLASGSDSVSRFGGATAPWVAIGFMVTLTVARSWTDRDRLLWTCIAAATYLYGWLAAYHLLYGVIHQPPSAAVWAEARLWVAAVAPACLLLGTLVVGSLRTGVIGDACLAAPLAWSLPEAAGAVHGDWSQVLLFTLPALS